MAQIINTNAMSLNAQRNLTTSSNSLATTIQRLSSGLRINSAKDDAAGLAISERFTTQIRGTNQAARNANDGISLAQTAEGALGEIGNNLQRIRELAVQARNATNSDSDRQALNAEVQLLKQEIQRVAEQTNFNGTNLLDGSFTNQAFQIGADQGQVINIAQIANANTNMLGSWTSASTAASARGTLPTGTPATAVQTPTTTSATGAWSDATSNVVGERVQFSVGGVSILDVPTEVDADGDAVATTVTDADVQAAITSKTADLAAAGITVSGSLLTPTGSDLTFTRADGSRINVDFTSTFGTPGGPANADFIGEHINGRPEQENVFPAITAGQLTIKGVSIEVGEAKDAAQRSVTLVNAINAKSHDTGVTAAVIDGQIQLTSEKGDFSVGGTLPDSVLKQSTGLAWGSTETLTGDNITKFAEGTARTGFAALDISSQADADNAILAMDAALNSINSARADLGAIQNRFSSTIANLNTSSENMSAARSRIRDADYAQETAELTRNQILQQAGTAMLAQANQVPQNVLSLLQ